MLLDSLSNELIAPSRGSGRCSGLRHGGYRQVSDGVVCHVVEDGIFSHDRLGQVFIERADLVYSMNIGITDRSNHVATELALYRHVRLLGMGRLKVR